MLLLLEWVLGRQSQLLLESLQRMQVRER